MADLARHIYQNPQTLQTEDARFGCSHIISFESFILKTEEPPTICDNIATKFKPIIK